jgi:hypothetical protein
MKFWGLAAIILVGVFAFVVGQRLSADAVGMAIGVLFGVLAGIPAALLVLASGRRRQEAEFEQDEDEEIVQPYGSGRRGRNQTAYGALPAQAPVIIFAPPATAAPPAAPYSYTNQYVAPHPSQQHALPGPTTQPVDARRAFKIVGEQEEWITEW